MTDTFHLITTWTSSLILLIMGLLLIAVGTPRSPQWKHLRYGCFYLSASYLILGTANLTESILELCGNNIQIKSQMVLSISFFQAMLFTGTSLVFVRPEILTLKKLLAQLSFIVPIVTIFHAAYFIIPSIYPAVLTITIFAYLLQLIYYTHLFHKEYSTGIEELEKRYCEEYAERLHWIRRLFYLSLGIGIMALLYVILPSNHSYTEIFTICYTTYYVYVVFCFITYGRNGEYLVKLVTSKNATPAQTSVKPTTQGLGKIEMATIHSAEPTPENDTDSEIKETRAEKRLSQALEQWVKDERYLCQDIPIEETANELGTDIESLHEYFLTHKGILFRTWRVMLRIEKAKHLLETNPTIKISELQTQVGFSDKSYFFRRFKQVTGKTPNEYRDYLRNQ